MRRIEGFITIYFCLSVIILVVTLGCTSSPARPDMPMMGYTDHPSLGPVGIANMRCWEKQILQERNDSKITCVYRDYSRIELRLKGDQVVWVDVFRPNGNYIGGYSLFTRSIARDVEVNILHGVSPSSMENKKTPSPKFKALRDKWRKH